MDVMRTVARIGKLSRHAGNEMRHDLRTAEDVLADLSRALNGTSNDDVLQLIEALVTERAVARFGKEKVLRFLADVEARVRTLADVAESDDEAERHRRYLEP